MTVKLPVGQAPVDGGLVGGKGGVVAPGVDPAAFGEAHRQLLGDSTIQFTLNSPEPPPQPPQWVGGSLPFVQLFFWAAIAAIVLFIVYLIVKHFAGGEFPWPRKRGAQEAPDESWRPEESEARALLGDADALAAKGLYSEAARLLLHRSIEDIDDKRPDLVRPALTSRDICGLGAIPERPRSAFARIAAMVERSLFAGRALVSADWMDCRAAYEEFAFAEGWKR